MRGRLPPLPSHHRHCYTRTLITQPVCDWLESGEGNPTPSASSTLWLIEISGEIDSDDRQMHANQIRTMLSGESILEYGVISDDLISNDINESTLDNLVWLIFLAVIVVVLLLALTFRSATMVVAPLVALLASLVWTYGAITLMGMRFSILEIAVAPVVLGLGIDYSIHLQRAYERAKEGSSSSSEAWAKALMELRVALSLAVDHHRLRIPRQFSIPAPPAQDLRSNPRSGRCVRLLGEHGNRRRHARIRRENNGGNAKEGLELGNLANRAADFQRGNAPLVLLVRGHNHCRIRGGCNAGPRH